MTQCSGTYFKGLSDGINLAVFFPEVLFAISVSVAFWIVWRTYRDEIKREGQG